jgi:hypothetical protein
MTEAECSFSHLSSTGLEIVLPKEDRQIKRARTINEVTWMKITYAFDDAI